MTMLAAIRQRLNRTPSALAWSLGAALVALAFYLTTLQWGVNGSQSPYATDVGELQNALPRWGTIHFTGYPLYTFLGSLFVTALRWVGIQPAAGASLFSALWGAVAIGLLAAVGLELGLGGPCAALSALAVALSTSLWIDASLAEIHTLTMAFTGASLLEALRFGRAGSRRDLLWLAVVLTQGAAHQRALAFLAPGLLALIWPQLRALWRGLAPALGLAALAPLTYLYLPLRAWMGAEWTFGEPGTWRGFWTMILDTKTERIIDVPASAPQWLERARVTAGLLREDWPLALVAVGLLGLLLPAFRRRRREALGLALAALAYLALCLVIWEGRVSDALLAAKLPVIYLAGLGVGLIGAALWERFRPVGYVAALALLVMVAILFVAHRPTVTAITRDPAAERVIATAELVARPQGAPVTLMALWGHDYWALTYAQSYRGQIRGLRLVDHNAPFSEIVRGGERLITLERTFYERPIAWWEERTRGTVYLSSAAPGLIEISPAPLTEASRVPPGASLALNNGVRILSAQVSPMPDRALALTVYWQAGRAVEQDYAVAVHLIAHDPPRGPEDILAQADRQHPVYGRYPTSRWQVGEIVRDDYVAPVPQGAQPVALRVAMYRAREGGGFDNSEWLVLPIRP